MSKNDSNPKIQLAEIIDELNLINGKVFQLKQSAGLLVQAVRAEVPNQKIIEMCDMLKIEENIKALQVN